MQAVCYVWYAISTVERPLYVDGRSSLIMEKAGIELVFVDVLLYFLRKSYIFIDRLWQGYMYHKYIK